MALIKKIKSSLAKRKKLRKYKKKVRKSTAYKTGKVGKLQKKIDIKAKKRSLGLGRKKTVQRKINKLTKKRRTTSFNQNRKQDMLSFMGKRKAPGRKKR